MYPIGSVTVRSASANTKAFTYNENNNKHDNNKKGDVFMNKKMRLWVAGTVGVLMTGLMSVNAFVFALALPTVTEPIWSMFEKGFLQDVRHNLWEISPSNLIHTRKACDTTLLGQYRRLTLRYDIINTICLYYMI